MKIIPRHLLLSPLLLPVFRLEHQWLDRHGGGEGGDGGGGEGQEEGGPRPQHPDGLHLGQSPGPGGEGGGVGVGGGVDRQHVVVAVELEQRLSAADL